VPGRAVQGAVLGGGGGGAQRAVAAVAAPAAAAEAAGECPEQECFVVLASKPAALEAIVIVIRL
jgi:hypothetical protein